MKRIVSYIYLTLFLFAIVLTCGCSAFQTEQFYLEEYEAPITEGIVSATDAVDSITVIKEPIFVPKMTQERICNPLFFASTNLISEKAIVFKNTDFSYELLKKTDWDELDRITEPTNVSFAAESWTGSAFIYKIEEDYIYLGTAGHCAPSYFGINSCDATFYFFDRKPVKVKLDTYEIGGQYWTTEGDYAMFRIPTSSLYISTLRHIKQVCYSKEAVDAVKRGDTIYSGNIWCQNRSEDFDRKIPVLGPGDKLYDWFRTYSNYRKVMDCGEYFWSSVPLMRGQSGSAIFDRYGNVVGTCSAGTETGTTVGMYTKLHNLDDLYQKLKKR